MDKPEPQVTMATGHRAKANKTKNTIHLKRWATRTQKKQMEVNLCAHEGKEDPVSHWSWTPNDENNTDAHGTIFIFKQEFQKSWWIWLDLNENLCWDWTLQ
jgi:hypothetical protein